MFSSLSSGFLFLLFRTFVYCFFVLMTDTSVPLASVYLLALSEDSWTERACLLLWPSTSCVVLTLNTKTGFFEQLSEDPWECHPGTVIKRTLGINGVNVAYFVSSVDPPHGVCYRSFS